MRLASSQSSTLAKLACFDGHSNETEWPAYASIAPPSWLGSARRGRGSRRLELLRMAATPGGARLGSADRDRRAQGLAKTLGGSPQHEAHERER